MADNRDAPRPAEEPLPCQPAHVGHICVVDWETEDPDSREREKGSDGHLESLTSEHGDESLLTSPSQCTRVCPPSHS